MDGPTRPPRVSGSGSGTLTPTNAPLKRSFDDLGSDDTVSVDGSGSSSAQASTNGDNDRNKRARSRSPLPVDSDPHRSVAPPTVASPYQSTTRSNSSEPPTETSSNAVLIDASHVSCPPQVSSVSSDSNTTSTSAVDVEIQVIEPLAPDASQIPAAVPMAIPVPGNRSTPFTSPISVASSATVGHTPARIGTRNTSNRRPASPSNRITSNRDDVLNRAREFQATVEAIRTIGPPSSESSAGSVIHSPFSASDTPNENFFHPDAREFSSRSTVVSGQSSLTASDVGTGSSPSVVIALDPYSLEHVTTLEESPPPSPDPSGDDQSSQQFALHLRRTPLTPRSQAGGRSLPPSVPSRDNSRATDTSGPSRIITQRRPDAVAPMNRNPILRRSDRRVRVSFNTASDMGNHNTAGRAVGGIVGEQHSNHPISIPTNQPTPREPNAVQVDDSLPHPPQRRQDTHLIPLRPLQPLPPLRPPSTAVLAVNRTDAFSAREVDRMDMQHVTLHENNRSEPSIRMSIDISPSVSPSSSASSFSDDIWGFPDTTRVPALIPPVGEHHHMIGMAGRTRRVWDHTTGISYDVPFNPSEDSPRFGWTSRGAPRTSQPLDPSLSSPYPSPFEPAPNAGSSSLNVGTTFPPALGPIERRPHNTLRDNRPVSSRPLSPTSFERTLAPPRPRPRESVANLIVRRRAADAGRRTGTSNVARNRNAAPHDFQSNPRRLPPFPPEGTSRPALMSEFASNMSPLPSLEPIPPSPPDQSVGFHDLMEEYLADLSVESDGLNPPVAPPGNPTTAQRGLRDRGHAPPGPVPEFTRSLDRMRRTDPVPWMDSPASGGAAWASQARPSDYANSANPTSRSDDFSGWSVYSQPPSESLENRALSEARASRNIRPTHRVSHLAYPEASRSSTPIPPSIGIHRHADEASLVTSDLRPHGVLDVRHLGVPRPHRNTNRQHVRPSGEGPNESLEDTNSREQARGQFPNVVALGNTGNQQAQAHPSHSHSHPSHWGANFNPSTANRGENMDSSSYSIPRDERRTRNLVDDHYTTRNPVDDRSTDHRASALAAWHSAREALPPQPLEEWGSLAPSDVAAGARTPEGERGLRSPSPASWELEQEMIRLGQIMQVARESAQALMRYADRIPIPSSVAPYSRSRLSTRAHPSPSGLPSDSDWGRIEGDTLSDALRGGLAGASYMPGNLNYDGDTLERERLRLRERRRRLRDMADDVQRAASGVDRIISFMGREGRAETRQARPQRDLPENNPDQREDATNLSSTEGFGDAGSGLGLSSSGTRFTPPAFIVGVNSPRDPRTNPRIDTYDASYPSDAAGSSVSGHLGSGSSLSGSVSTSSRPTHPYLEPTGTSGSDSATGEFRPRALRFQQHRQRLERLAPIHSRNSSIRDASHPRSGFFRAGRVETEDRPFHQIFAAHRLANRDYISDANWDASYEGLIRLGARIGEARSRHTPAEILSTLQRGTFREFPNPANETRCPICLDDYTDNDTVLAMHPCTHFFHSDCLQQWLQTSRSCPNCRTRVQLRSPSEAHAARPREAALSSAGASLTQQAAPSPMFSVIHHASQTSSPATSVFLTTAEPFQVSDTSSPTQTAFDLPPNVSTEQTRPDPGLQSEGMDQDPHDARRGRQP